MTGWRHEGSSHARGYGAPWRRLRHEIMMRDGALCQVCKRKGRVTVATEVDHIVPKAKLGTDDPANLQAICSECHAEKSAVDNGARPRVTIGADGWPVD